MEPNNDKTAEQIMQELKEKFEASWEAIQTSTISL